MKPYTKWKALILRFVKIAAIGAVVALLPEITKYADTLRDPWTQAITTASIAAVWKFAKEWQKGN